MMSGSSNSRSRAHSNGEQRVTDRLREHDTEATASVEDAIQASCGTLLALRASLASVEELAGEHGHAEASLKAAIELVWVAISDLRESIPSGERNPLSLGFVAKRRSSDTPK